MSRPARSADPLRRTAPGSLATFLLGVPLGAGLLYLCGPAGPLGDPELARYTAHAVEKAEVVLFACGLCGLLGKLWAHRRERAALAGPPPLAAWDGTPTPAADVGRLADEFGRQPARRRDTVLGRRIAGVLDFVACRGSADHLDDHLRGLSDTDALALEGSYSLLRFITWAIPILGFLGTVQGITGAIAGVTPEVLEQSLSGVTDGLAQAFDSTAMALFLTMVLMLVSAFVERVEQGVLTGVDAYADAELSHRFVRTAAAPEAATGPALQQQTQALLGASHDLVERQVDLWAQTITEAEKHWSQAGVEQQTRLGATLQNAMEAALARYGQRLVEMEATLVARHEAVLAGLTDLSASLRESGHEHQLALARLTDTTGLQVELLGKVQLGEHQLARMQEGLSQNLALLANSGTFEQAVQSLTAAIHLLTTRVNPPAAGPAAPRLYPRPDAA